MSDTEKKARKPAAKRQDTSLTFRLNPLLVEQLDALVPLFEREPAALAGATANRSAVARACLTYGVSHYLRKLRDEAPTRRPAKGDEMSPAQAVIAAALMESDRLAALPKPELAPSRPPTLPETMSRHKATLAALAEADKTGDNAKRHRLAELLTRIESEEIPLAEQLDALRLDRDRAKLHGAGNTYLDNLTNQIAPLKAKLAALRQVTP